MLAWLISSSVRLRTLVVVVAAGLLISAPSASETSRSTSSRIGAALATVKTESLGLSAPR